MTDAVLPCVEALAARMRTLHPCRVPELIAFEAVGGLPDHLRRASAEMADDTAPHPTTPDIRIDPMPALFRRLIAAPTLSLVLVLLLPLFAAAPARAVDESDLLPVDEAYGLTVEAAGPDRVRVRWKIADGYYLYRHRFKFAADGISFGEPALPPKFFTHAAA